MRFFADEHVPVLALEQLRIILSEHSFDDQHTDSDFARGTDDDALFGLVAKKYDALITNDRSQLKGHREALIHQNLHWVGIPENPGGGRLGINYLISTLAIGIPEFLACLDQKQWQGAMWVQLKGVHRRRSQVLVIRDPRDGGRAVPEGRHEAYLSHGTALRAAS